MRREIDSNDLQVREALMKMASFHLYFASAALFICVLIIVIALWEINSKAFLLSWFFVITAILIFRDIQAYLFLKKSPNISLESYEKRFKFCTILTAFILSGGVSFLLLQSEPFYQTFLTMIAAGLSAGAVMTLSTHKNIVMYYLIILLLPLIFAVYIQNTHIHSLMAILITLFLIMLIIFSRRYNGSIVHVITSRLLYEEAKKEIKYSNDRFGKLFEQAPIAMCTYDRDLIVTEVNEAAVKLSAQSTDKLVGLDMKKLPDQSARKALEAVFKKERGSYEGVYHTLFSDKDIWVSIMTMPMSDIDDNIVGGLAIISDITEKIEAENAIKHYAFYDHLTNLANRFSFQDRLKQQLSRLQRHKRVGALIFIDIDYFKDINDSLGHDAGDEVLKSFSQRVLSITRKEDTVARLGGDEFVILLSDLSDNEPEALEMARNVSQKIHSVMESAIVIEGMVLNVTLSLGVALIGKEGETIDEALKHADIAMYKAKEAGRNCTKFYSQINGRAAKEV